MEYSSFIHTFWDPLLNSILSKLSTQYAELSTQYPEPSETPVLLSIAEFQFVHSKSHTSS